MCVCNFSIFRRAGSETMLYIVLFGLFLGWVSHVGAKNEKRNNEKTKTKKRKTKKRNNEKRKTKNETNETRNTKNEKRTLGTAES